MKASKKVKQELFTRKKKEETENESAYRNKQIPFSRVSVQL